MTAYEPFQPRVWQLAHGAHLTLGARGHIMGILNVTPDSFSDGGKFDGVDAAVAHAQRMVAEGATIIDIGAESTRPGAASIDAQVEQKRLLPVVEAVVAALPDAIISIDTYRAETAELAIKAGGHILNDVWGLQKEPEMAQIAAKTGAGLVIMHTNRDRQTHLAPIDDQFAFFDASLEIASRFGVDRQALMLDPGFGFGKEPDWNLALMAGFSALHRLELPWLIGTSRKRFLGHVTGREALERDVATAATTALLRQMGAAVFRVHDVAINRDALLMCDAMMQAGQK